MGAAALPAAIFGGSAVSAGAGLLGASQASDAQAQAAQQATQAQLQIYGENERNLQPYIQSGNVAQDTLMRAMPTLVKPFMPTMDQLSQTPGYQFALQQGELATANQNAGMGWGKSGGAIKGAESFAQGLASQTYQQQFQNYLQQNNQIYDMLAGPGQSGENAAAALAGVGSQTGTQIGQNIIGAGNARGAADIAGANAISGGINSGIGNYLQASMFSNLMGGGGIGGYQPVSPIAGPYQGSPMVNP